MSAVATVLRDRCSVPVTAPMETIGDPALQRLLRRVREGTGTRIVGLDDARRELRAALARGEGVGLVADRDITGGGLPATLFGLPTTLPMGPAYLALEYGAPLHVAAVRRAQGGSYRGGLVTLPHPPADLSRRARIEALLEAEAQAFEKLVAAAPEQWWTVFFPIWDGRGPAPAAVAGEQPPSSVPRTAPTPRSPMAGPTSTSTPSPRTASAASTRSSRSPWRRRSWT